MAKTIFEYDDYKAFTIGRIDSSSKAGRGMRAKIADALGCQVAYVSHVLAGDRHFSLEQGEALGRFFELRSEEMEFLLDLIECNRAGTAALRKILFQRLERNRLKHLQLKRRVGFEVDVSEEDQATYYSSWHYQAIRMMLTIPEYRTQKLIAQKLRIPLDRVNEVLSFFLSRGFATEENGVYTSTSKKVHLGSDSPHISKLHSNWRTHTLQALNHIRPEDFHYSAAVTLAKEDFQKVREILVKAVLDSHNIIAPSKEERFCVMSIDFYGVF